MNDVKEKEMSFLRMNTRSTAILAIATLVSGSIFLSGAASAADASCAPVKQAVMKMAQAPSFTMVELAKGTAGNMKVVGDSTGIYGDDGKSRAKLGERADFVAKIQKSIDEETFAKCKVARSDKIGGKAVTVYTYNTGASGTKKETMWVGKDDGRVYRVEDADKNGMIATYGE